MQTKKIFMKLVGFENQQFCLHFQKCLFIILLPIVFKMCIHVINIFICCYVYEYNISIVLDLIMLYNITGSEIYKYKNIYKIWKTYAISSCQELCYRIVNNYFSFLCIYLYVFVVNCKPFKSIFLSVIFTSI